MSYPGSTVLDGDRKVVHRGEFEVETVRGEHYVRMYTAVLDPAEHSSDFKDVHQNADGTVDVFAGRSGQTFWVGGGRPMRAVQWAAKYEHDTNRSGDMQPVLRSFLVPLKTFNQVSREATVESRSKDNTLAMNVDQSGDTNQFGLRGEHFEQMRDNALKGSLVTYAPSGKDYKLPDLAGRREDISDLYVRLGLNPGFDSAGLGRENDPWFSWSKENKYFRNDPAELRTLAKTLGDHYHTWKGSPEAYFTPRNDSIPDVTSRPASDSQEQRQQDLNVFLNTHGPSGQVVGQLTDGIGHALSTAVDAGPHTVPLDGGAVRDHVLIEAKNLNNALTTAVTNLVRERAMGPDGFVPPTARIDTVEGLRDVMNDPSFVDEVAKRSAEQMVNNAVNAIGATHGTQDFRAGLSTIVQDAVKSQFALTDGKFSPEVEKGFQKTTGSKRGYFTGPRVDVIGGAVSKHLKADGNIETLVHNTGLGLDRDTVKQRLSDHVVPSAVSDVAKQNFVDASPDQLKDTFRNALQGGADRVRTSLNEDPVLKFVQGNERTRLGDAAAQVINDPHTVDRITFTPVTHAQADAFMNKVPDYATQAEIGAAIATDERRVKADFNTRENQLDPSGLKVESKTFENEYGRWGADAVQGHTRQHPAGVFERHQQIGQALNTTIGDQLARPDERSAKTILDQLVREADRATPDRATPDQHDSLRRKFDEVVKADPKNPRYRAGDTANPNTFGEHAQMVLNQYLRLTQGQNDNGRFVSRDALAKAILFHDMEKVNSKNQFGDGQGRHDQEPEHRGAVDQMNRHEGLWDNSRDFRIARAMVDADPFGFYFRPGKGLDVEGVHAFVKGLAHQVGSPRGGTPTAVDVRNLFNEFHEYYQADFSSYFSDSHFVHEQHGDVRSFGKPALSGLRTGPDGKLVTTDDGHRFAYLDDNKGKGTKQSYEQKYRDLRDRFDQDVAKEEQERVVYVNDDGDPKTGISHDSDRGVQAVKESNPNAKPSALARVRKRDFTDDENGAIDDALSHYSPIIGEQRANSSRAGVDQEVRHIGAVNFGLERGELAYGMGGEYIASHQTVNLYAPATLSREFGGGRRGLEGTVAHELSHGLLKYALDDYGKHVGSWNEDGSPNRGPDAEPPSDSKARTDQADFKAALKSHLLDRPGLERKAPRRAEFVAQLAQQHPDVFARQDNELSGPRAERIYQALKDRQTDFNEHSGYWDRDGFPSFTGERPITKYGATNVNEDMAETAKYYFLDPDKLRAEAPHRAEFFDQLIAGWKKPDSVLVDDNDSHTDDDQQNEPDDRALRDRLPEYARDGQALGALVPVDVRGAKDVGTAIERLIRNADPGRTNPPKPVGIDAITGTLDGPGFESFLGQGRKSMVRVGEKWYEVHVKAEPDLSAVGADQVTKQPHPTIADVNDQNQVTHAQPQTDTTTGTVGTSYFGLFPAGPYASVGATAQLASPSVEHTSTVTGTEQRVIRSAGDVDRADVGVKYTITVSDQNGGHTGSTVDGQVSLLLSQDLANLKPHETQGPPTPPKNDWSEQIEFLTPEAVIFDEQSLFNQVSGLLHPSVTKFGAPGRGALQDFVSRGGVRGVLGTALQGGPVVSNDLLSPHGSHRDAVQLQARPKDVELVGVVPGDSELRFNDSSVNGGSTAAASKSGLDVNGIFGGGAYIPGAVGGVGGVAGSASAKVTQTSTSGTSVTAKSTVNAKGDVGLYKVKVDVEVTTASGEKATVEATAYVRMGLPEAKAQGLPVPDGTRDKFTDVGKRHEPPYLASAVAAGQVRPGSFTPAAKVQPQIENALRDRPGFAKFLPRWDKFQSDTKGSTRDVAERLANLRKLTSAFSPGALRSKMDSLLGPGVSVQLKRRGLFTDEYINVTVKAKIGPGEHLGQATGRSVKGSIATSPSLNSATTTEKGWSAGLEGRVIIPAATAVTSLGVSPTVTPVQYSDTTTWKNTGGPTVTTTTSAGGSPDSQVFKHDVEFEVEVTSYTRNRPWVKRLTPGSPFRVTPTVSTVAKTGDNGGVSLPRISGKVDLWVNDGSALKKDPAEFAPGKSGTIALTPSETPRIDDLAGSRQPNPPKFLHVEAVANTEVLRDEALRQLQRAAGGDAVLGLPGGEARKRVDRMFSPETFRSGLPRFLSQGAQSGGFRYERRVADRVGGLGMGMSLSNPKLVVTSDAGGSDTTYAGGGKAGYEKSHKQSIEANAQLGLTIRPDGSDTHGQGQLYGSLKWSPWVRTSGSSKELSASVDHVNRAPSKSRTVLVQYDADVRLVAESRQESLVNGSTSRSGADVKLPGAVFVRMTEDQAREQGLLPALEPRTAPPGELTSPALVGAQSSSLGAAVVENAPDLSQLVRDARAQLGRTGDKLLPKSVLDDSMNNLQRMLDVASPESVTSLVDSALDGGVPLVLHDAGILSTDSYQVLLKGTVTDSEFLDVVHDGGEVDHVVNSTGTAKENAGHGSSYGGQFRGAGRGLFQSNPSKTSGYDGAYAAISGTKSKSDQTVSTDTTTTAQTASASGPAVRHRHQVRFELVVQRGGRTYPIAHQDTRLTVRSSADDQKISAQNQPARTAYAPRTTELTAADATLERLTEWQQQGTGTLPRSALVEGLRGAAAVRAGAVRALRLAGAGDGLTGPGTGANNTLVSSVTNEMLQANLPGMVDRPLEAPELHEAAIFKNGHGGVKVYARLVNPDLTGLSDSVKLERSDQATTTFTGEAKQTVSGENQYNLGNGGLTDPDKNAHSWGGVDGRSPVGVSDPTSSTAGGQRSVVDKPKGRTGLVGFDVEYRVVADLGNGRTGAVEVRVPASTLVRMSDADLEKLLGEALPDSLTKAQDAVKDAATEWRTAEEAVETAQREADDRWLDQRDNVKTLAKGAGDLQVTVAADPVRDLRQALTDAENDARDAGRTLRDGNTEITRQQDVAAQALTMAAATDEGSPERQALLDQVTRAEQRIQDIRGGQPALVRQRQEAQDRAARLAGVLDDYRNDNSDHTARRDSSLEDVRQAREKADEARRKWWDAKQEVDWRLDTHLWPRPRFVSTLDPNAVRTPATNVQPQVIRRKPVPQPTTHVIPRKPVPQPTTQVIPRKPVPQPSTTTAGPSTESHRDGTVEARDTGPATISGWDAGSGRPYDFDVSEIEQHQVTDRSGKVVAVSFLPASEQTSGVEHDWVADNSGTVSTLDEGVTPDRFDPVLRDARDNGTTPDLNGRRFGEWAEQSAAPWGGKDSGDTFFVFAHGRPQSVKLTLLGGRTVRVDGAAFARIVANSGPFGQAGPKSSVTLIACGTGQTDGPGGVAHDFQRALNELDGPTTVHAPTKPALFGRDTSTLGRAVGATGGFTAVTDGGHFRTFGGRPGDEAIVGLVHELEQGHHAELPDGPIPLSDHDGTLALTSTVESQLADEVTRTGELRLTSVQDLVARHERPDVVWSAALTRLAGRPDVDVHAVVDTRRDPETGQWSRTPLPPMARGLLTVTGKGSWGEHELSRPARLNPAWSTGPARETTTTSPDARHYAETLVEHHLDGAPLPPVTVPADFADRFKADVTRLLDERSVGDLRPSLDDLVRPDHTRLTGEFEGEPFEFAPGSVTTTVLTDHTGAARGLTFLEPAEAAKAQVTELGDGRTFLVTGDGDETRVRVFVTGPDGERRAVLVDGPTLARLVTASPEFVAAKPGSVTLVQPVAARRHASGELAHDFRQALEEAGGPSVVHERPDTLRAAVDHRLTELVSVLAPGHVLTQDGAYSSANELVRDLRTAAADRGPAPEHAPLLGPDLFGLYCAPEPPEFLRGHDYRGLTAGQGLELLNVLDLAKGYQLGSEHTDPANLADNREWTIETEREDGKLSAWAPGDVEPLAKVTATPLLMHAIWLGGPLRDAGTMHTFRQNFGGAADRLNGSIVPVLWTDVPRWQTDLAFTTEPPADGPDPLADVRDFVGWAQEHGIQLVNVNEVFTSENPMLLQEFYNSEAVKQAGPGYAAASDILRMELMHRFGGLYTDGDNVVHNLNDVILAAQSDEGYATHRVGSNIANSAFTMSQGHPFARAYLDQQRDNYGRTQKNLMPAAVNALGQEFFATPLGRVHRNSIMHRTGPEALSRTARRIGLPSAQHLPGMSEIRMNSDASWLKPPPAGESAPPSPDRGETLELTKRVVQTLVRGLYNREGDLHLTAVESAVNRHPEPGLVWHAALSYLAADPELAPLVRTVTDQRSYTGEVHDVPLPPAARALLDVDPSRVHRNLGEVQRVATMREPGAVLVSDVDTPLEVAAERLARALVEADDRGEPLTPIHVTGTGPDARARATEAAKELAGHLGREFGESRRDLLARVPVKIRASEGAVAGVTVSFRPEHGTAVEVDLGRPRAATPEPTAFPGLSEPADAVARPWQHDGRTIGVHYTDALAGQQSFVFDALPRVESEDMALVHDFTEQLRANGFDLPQHLGTDSLAPESLDELPSVSYLVSGDHPSTAEDKRVLAELSHAAELDWWYRPPLPSGPVPLEDRAATVKLLSGVLGKLRRSAVPALDLTAVAADVARHERPDLVWSAALELATTSKTITSGTRYVIDRRLDPATGRWSPVELPEAARERFTVTGKAVWHEGAVYRPVRLHAEPGRLRDLDERPPAPLPLTDERAEATVARWVAESTVERMADGLPAPCVAVSGTAEVRDRLVARIQADLAALSPAGVTAAAELVTVSPGDDAVATISLPLTPSPATLSPAETAVAVGVAEEYTLLQLHGVTDTLLGKDNPAAVGALLDVAAEVAGGTDVGQAADAVEVLDRHGALDAALSAPGGRSLLLGHFRGILGRPDAERYARDLATAIRKLAPGSLSPDVVREAVRGALNGWRGDEVGEKGTLEQRVERTRETLWLMRRFRVTNLAWLYRWRIAAAVRRYQEQEKTASAQQAAQLAKLPGGGAGDDR
ncbi:hypothetical protein OG943_34695 [Amycolatopsis sp. NBC_00345]|uniref:hypothetical protein n=1 Tax=Amycolatopsis sp. NBC_00345 TaxID=2975955 RepID=UPI002E259393